MSKSLFQAPIPNGSLMKSKVALPCSIQWEAPWGLGQFPELENGQHVSMNTLFHTQKTCSLLYMNKSRKVFSPTTLVAMSI